MSAHTKGWIGVDLDGTLAEYTAWQGPQHIGKPVPKMLARVKQWLKDGVEVRIFTARVYSPPGNDARIAEANAARAVITAWCVEHLGAPLPVTCTKDYAMVLLYDDRCVQVIANTGERADGRHDDGTRWD